MVQAQQNHPERVTAPKTSAAELEVRQRALRTLARSSVPFVVAGAYAFFEYTGIFRDTKDVDLAVRRSDLPRAFEVLEAVGFRTEIHDERWLGKAFDGDHFIDLIFSARNGIAVVDEGWFDNAPEAEILGERVKLSPPEEMIWSKAFVNERERYDGADINHLIYAVGDRMDWTRLLARFGNYWEVLLSHLTLYRFAYPCARSRVPQWVMRELMARQARELRAGDLPEYLCRGSLLSGTQYRHDYENHGFVEEVPLGAPGQKGDVEERAPISGPRQVVGE